MTFKTPPNIKAALEAVYEHDFPQFSHSFEESIWETFDLDAAMEVLLHPKKSFKHHKQTVFMALSAWVTAPHVAHDRKTAILMCIRLAMAQVEKEVFEFPQHEWFIRDLVFKMRGLGPQFMEQIYFPVGGIKALNRDSFSGSWSINRKSDYQRTLNSLMTVIQVVHHERMTTRDPQIYRPVSLKRAFDCIREFNSQRLQTSSAKGPNEYVEQGSIENAIRNYGYVGVLAYAAELVEIADGHTLLDRFYDHKIRLSTKGRRKALKDWLAISAYLFEDIIGPLRSPKLMPPKPSVALNVPPKAVQAPAFETWEQKLLQTSCTLITYHSGQISS